MTARVRTALVRRLESRHTSEAGYFVIMLAIVVASGFLMVAAAISVDTARWYDEIARVQKAADAAALAGVPFMPYEFAKAEARAKSVAARNGYDDAHSDIAVTVEQGDLASQLRVTVSSRISNAFGGLIGVSGITIARSGTADYKGPAPMGSPCNSFGNEPTSGDRASSARPVGTVHASGTADPLLAPCSSAPQFWAVVEGPETGKLQGDRYSTRRCENTAANGVDNCASTGNDAVNSEYDDFGYVFIVKVAERAVGRPVDVQLYDPQFSNTEGVENQYDTSTTGYGDRYCDLLPAAGSFGTTNSTALNPFVTVGDAKNRYSSNGSTYTSFCNSDSFPGNRTGRGPVNSGYPQSPPSVTQHNKMVTSFVLREQVDSQDPEQAPVQKDTGGSDCIKQYGSVHPPVAAKAFSYNSRTYYYKQYGAWSVDLFKQGSSTYNADLSRVFHNWSSLCTFTPQRAGDYYLQVRTNVALSGSALIQSGNVNAAALTGNLTTGEGSNSFAIRAKTEVGYENDVAVSGYDHMPIFVNVVNTSTSTATEFNLIRVLPGAAGQFITFSYFDAGDAEATGYVKVLVPPDATGSIKTTPFPNSCRTSGGSAPSTPTVIANCQANIATNTAHPSTPKPSKNNGRVQTISIPIPTDYTCNVTSLRGCWYRVQVQFGSGPVHDVTTWDATIEGDPVRLIE